MGWGYKEKLTHKKSSLTGLLSVSDKQECKPNQKIKDKWRSIGTTEKRNFKKSWHDNYSYLNLLEDMVNTLKENFRQS